MPALFFDFDGLILDTETPELRAWEREFARWGHILPDGYWAKTIGRGADDVDEWPIDILTRLIPNLPDSEAIEDRVREDRLDAILANPVLPGVRELMTAARGAGRRVGVVSSSKHDWVDAHLARLGLADMVEITTCRGDAPRAKPHPDLYLLAQERFGTSGGWALEDSPNGATAALAAGLNVAVIPNPVTRDLAFPPGVTRFDSMADVTLEHLDELARAKP